MILPPQISAPLARSAMAYVLAGGRGSRLMELTDIRAKPAVYFGGKSRIIDFALKPSSPPVGEIDEWTWQQKPRSILASAPWGAPAAN